MPGLAGAVLHRSMPTVIDQTRDMRDRFVGSLIGLLLVAAESVEQRPLRCVQYDV